MPKFKPYDYRQSSMVVINYEDQLQQGTFEYAIHYLIENRISTSIFHDAYENDSNGRPAYDPAILLKIVLFAYSKGITSSREIQWCCENNIIFKALSCDTVPHFTTIAHFVSNYPEKIADIFEQVLLVCYQEGLLGNELFAIDGCKMPSDAAKEWSGTFSELAEKREKLRRRVKYQLDEHRKLDREKGKDQERLKRSRKTIVTLDDAFEKIDQFLKTNQPRMGKGKQNKEVKSNITDNESAKMTTSKGTIQGYNGVAAVDKRHQIIVDAQAFGDGQEHHTLQPVVEGIRDRMSRIGIHPDIYSTGVIITADTGFANEANMKYLHDNGINGYIPDNRFRSRDPRFVDQKKKYGKRHQSSLSKKQSVLIPASDFDFDPIKKQCRCPAGEDMWLRSEGVDEFGNQKLFFEGRLSKCRDCSLKSKCMKNPASADTRKGHGRQVSFIVGRSKKSNYTDWMRHRVDSRMGKEIYGHRMSVVEPVFGNLSSNKGLNRFSLRGKDKVQGQWQLFCMVQNIEKLVRYAGWAH